MLLESSSLTAAEAARNRPPTVVDSRDSRPGAGAVATLSTPVYARVHDEVEAGARKNPPAQSAATGAAKQASLWQNGDFGFADLIDVINPLQHLPIIATIYRNLSGDQIGMGARVIGGALWGRIGGFVAGIVNSVVEWFTGKDIGDHVYGAIWGKPDANAMAQGPQQRTATPAADAKSETLPPNGGARKNRDDDRVSVLAPGNPMPQRFEKSLYLDEDARDRWRARPPTVHLRA